MVGVGRVLRIGEYSGLEAIDQVRTLLGTLDCKKLTCQHVFYLS